MSTATLNQDAPPAPVSNTQDFIRFEPFPATDSYVLTLVGYNYIASYPFEREDDNGRKFTKEAPAIEFFWGGMVDGKAYFTKSWPTAYSIHEKANYGKTYTAITGKVPDAKQRPNDMLGGHALVQLRLEQKKSKKGKEYTAVKIVSVGAVPKILLPTATKLADLKPAFDAALAKSGDKADESTPF